MHEPRLHKSDFLPYFFLPEKKTSGAINTGVPHNVPACSSFASSFANPRSIILIVYSFTFLVNILISFVYSEL